MLPFAVHQYSYTIYPCRKPGKNQDDNARDIRLATICQTGGSNASLTGITMGENKGMMLLHTAIELLGELMAAMEI